MKPSRKTIARTAVILALIFTLLAGSLFWVARSGSPAAQLLRQGNQAFDDGNFMDALGIYQMAQNRFPQLAEPFYNAANALYRQESYPDAIAQIDQALQANADDSLVQSSYYNKGNAAYNSQDLDAAIQSYINALLLNPDDADAKYNLELALQQKQQQEQQQQQDQQNQDQQNQDEQNQDQQDQQNQDQQDQQNQDQQDQSQDGQQNQDQQDQGSSSDQQNDQQQDQNQDSPNQDNQNQDQGSQGEQNDQPPDQQQPQPGQGQPQDGNPSDQQPNGMVPQPGERLTAEQARQLLAAIAQGSQTLQERLQQLFVSPRPPSGQDW